MTFEDFHAVLQTAAERHVDSSDSGLALTLVAPPTDFRPFRVRPSVLKDNPDGTRVYGFTKRQVHKMLVVMEGISG